MARPSTHTVRAMLAVPDFGRLLRVRLTGQFGDGVFQGALFGAAFFNPEKATSAAAAAAAFATLLLPYSVVGPFAGVLLDRWSRQRVLQVANVLRAVLVVGLAVVLGATGATSPGTIGLALLTISLNRFVLSGLSASLPQVVEARLLVTANSFTTTLGGAAGAVGGFTAVGLRALVGGDDAGAERIALVAALVYLGAAALAARIERQRLGPVTAVAPEPLRHAVRTVARGLLAGAHHVRERPPAARALTAITAHRFFSGLLFVSVLLLYTEQGWVHRGLAGLGQVLTVGILGGLLAALITPRVTRRIGTGRWIVTVLATAGVVTGVLFPPYTHASLLIAGFGLGFTAQAAKICVDTIVQESVEDAYRGRVFSLYDTAFNVSFVAAAGLAALLVPDDGRSLLVVGIVSSGYLLTSVLYGVLVLRREGDEAPEPVSLSRP